MRTGAKTMRKVTLLLTAMALAVLLAALPAQADATFVVDRTDDDASAQACAVAPNDCSFRGAITKANAVPGADVIEVPAGTYTLKIPGADEDASAAGDLDITQALTIKGAGANSTTVAGDGAEFGDRIFHNHGGVSTTISGLTITGGSGTFYGGGIHNEGGTLRVERSTTRDNTAVTGGGVSNVHGILRVEQSTISGNTGTSSGGGIFSLTSGGFGPSKTTITNSTISGNTAGVFGGGGVRNYVGLTEIVNSTITNNSAPDNQGSGVVSYGHSDDTLTDVFSSIISGNTEPDNTNTDVDYTAGNGTNSFNSGGYNLIGDGNATDAFDNSGDKRGVAEPGLEPLSLNAPGSTMTHALKEGSPALNAGAPSLQCPEVDQRGVNRPQQGACDIGSLEMQDTTAPTVKRAVPTENSTIIVPARNIKAYFSEAMDPTTITNATFKLYKKGSRSALEAALSYNAARKRAVLNPEANLERGVAYKVVLTTGARDLSGNALDQDPSVDGNQSKVWFFKVRP